MAVDRPAQLVSDPNLQNIPIRSEQGRQIRQAFLPREGWQLLTADYSQIELRLLAHFSGDEKLREAFAEDRDIHAAVAAEIFDVPEDQVTSDQRRVAKTVNFGVIYGMSAHGLAVRLRDAAAGRGDSSSTPTSPATRRCWRTRTTCWRSAGRRATSATILGRRRRFDPTGIRERSTYQNRNGAEREAINMEIQGSAADLIKLAMLNVYRRLKADKLQAKMLLRVHDELVFEAPPEEVPDGGRPGPRGDDRGDDAERAAEGGSGRGAELAGRGRCLTDRPASPSSAWSAASAAARRRGRGDGPPRRPGRRRRPLGHEALDSRT